MNVKSNIIKVLLLLLTTTIRLEAIQTENSALTTSGDLPGSITVSLGSSTKASQNFLLSGIRGGYFARPFLLFGGELFVSIKDNYYNNHVSAVPGIKRSYFFAPYAEINSHPIYRVVACASLSIGPCAFDAGRESVTAQYLSRLSFAFYSKPSLGLEFMPFRNEIGIRVGVDYSMVRVFSPDTLPVPSTALNSNIFGLYIKLNGCS